jgi:hypothetical protein
MTEHQIRVWKETFVVAVFLSICTIPPFLAAHSTHRTLMKEAFDRGFAVQCVGKIGYHWECD